MRTLDRISVLVVTGALSFAGCSKGEQATADTAAAATKADTTPKSLYDRLGGKTAITAVVDSFVAKVAADSRINKKFAKSDVGRVKTMLVGQICAATGG